MMTPAFQELPHSAQSIHLIAIGCVLCAVLLLIAPAAIHRIAFGGNDEPQAYEVGAALLTCTLAPLALHLLRFYVATTRMLASEWLARAYAAATLVFLMTFWYLVPLVLGRAPRAQ
jgi:hypothetical protein